MILANMHDAVQAIGRAVGLHDIAPNAAGVVELVFGGQLSVYLQVVGEDALEVQLRLGEQGRPLTVEAMNAMLKANLSLVHGRLAVEPGSDRVVYCARLPAVGQPAAALMTQIAEALREGTALKLEGFASLLDSAAGRQDTLDVLSETAMRV